MRNGRQRCDAPVRLSYIPGSGDLAGTYACGLRGEHDQRVPIITYSAQFFELAKRLKLDTQIIAQTPVPSEPFDPSFIFRAVDRRSQSTEASSLRRRTTTATQCVKRLRPLRLSWLSLRPTFLLPVGRASAGWSAARSDCAQYILADGAAYWRPEGHLPASPACPGATRSLDDGVCPRWNACAR